MNYQWRSPRGPINNYDSPTISPLTVRNRFENAVPAGTVASRVRFLQNLANPASTPPAPTSPNRRRENSRAGYGRRMTSRFVAPAVRNVNPDEQPIVENSHTFLGLNSPRINHSEEHAIVDHKTRYDRAPEINDQTRPQKLSERLQYDVGAVGSKARPQRNMRRKYSGNGMDLLKEVNSFGSQSHFVAQTSIFPSPAHDEAENRGSCPLETRSRQTDTLKSDASALTTSTTRRQSVRDLFSHYGIERPAGLLSSSEDASRDLEDTLRPARSHRYCHVCSWLNSGSQNKCWRCRHRLCVECDALSPLPNGRKEAGLDYIKKFPKKVSEVLISILQTKLLKQRAQGLPGESLVRPGPSPIQKSEEESPRNLSGPSLPIKLPSFHNGKSTQRKKYPKTHSQSIQLPERTKLLRIQSTSRTNTCVRDSPFVIADQILSGGKPVRVLPIPISVRISGHHSHHSRRTHGNENHHQDSCQSASSSSDAGDCDSPSCRATHHGHAPFRHSITCTRKKRRILETDDGYTADTSLVEDVAETKDRFHPHYSHVSRSHSRTAPASRPSKPCSDLSNTRKTSSTYHLEVPEYVECRGYPRTGHARHGSPTISGVVGQCQHCLDDCQCAACQSTHHRVRCCVHEDHQAIVHHHHTPRKVTGDRNSLELPPSPARNPDRTAELPPLSPARTVSTIIAPRSQYKIPTPQLLRKSLDFIKPLKSGSKKSTLEENGTLLTSKQSTSMKEASKPLTPSPWVSMPKVRTKTTAVESAEQVSRRGTVNISLDIRPDKEPPPPFKEEPTLAPPATRNELTPEMGDEPADGTWVTVHSDHDHEHNHRRRKSCSLFSSKGSSFIKAMSPSIALPSCVSDLSRPASRRAKSRISAVFKLRDTETVPRLNKKLETRQEELKRIEKEFDERIGVIARGGGRIAQSDLPKETGKVERRVEELERTPSAASHLRGGTEKRRRWRLRLGDRKSSRTCENDKPVEVTEHILSDEEVVDDKNDGKLKRRKVKGVEEHRLSDDQVVIEKRDVTSKVVPGTWIELPGTRGEGHECAWKTMVLAEQDGRKWDKRNADLGIKGITVLIHIDGREDLVVKAELSDASKVRAGKG
jgi:hypothetical protein